MKILIAPDSFKHSMPAIDAAESIWRAAVNVIPDIEYYVVPLSDGGEGFTETLVEGANGFYAGVAAHDALLRKIKASIGWIDKKRTAVLDLADAAGIEMLQKKELNPWVTSTFGVGEVIRAALDEKCSKIIIGLGGSATNDAGVGMAMALGVKFYDKSHNEIGMGGGELGKIHHIDISGLDKRLKDVDIVVGCDVTNVLCGENGASLVYGPQKGANASMVKSLDENLRHYAEILHNLVGKDVGNIPGAGAAGGTAASLIAFANASLIPGFDLVRHVTRLEEKIKTCDLVITGEGKIDYQTSFGKAPGRVAHLALKYKIPVVAFAGILGKGYETLYNEGFNCIISIRDVNRSRTYSLTNGPMLLEKACEKFFTGIREKIWTN